jgi:hypothetical protein
MEKRKIFRRENSKFELYRGRFYRDLNEMSTPNHNISTEALKDVWFNMWKADELVEDTPFEEYLLEYSPGNLEEIYFPTEEEFSDIIRKLPCWKAAGTYRIFNYFIKNITSLHQSLYKVIKETCLSCKTQEDWFYRGITYLIPKGTPKSGKDFRPITCMSNLYKLTTKCVTAVIQLSVEQRRLLSENQMGTVRKVPGAREQALTNIMLNNVHNYALKTAWIDVKKAFDSVSHPYLLECIERLGLPLWIAKFLKNIISKWNLEIRAGNEVVLDKKVERGILQGDSLSPLLFVLCMDPLSKKLNGTYPMIEVKLDELHYTCNHLLFIDDLKLFAASDEQLEIMVKETKSFFKTVGLEMNAEKSATNSTSCENYAKLLESHEGYKYLGITETKESRNTEDMFTKILKSIESRVEALCRSNLNAKNLIRAINEYAISQINYYVGIIEIEPDQFKEIDSAIRRILIKHHVHQQPSCKERLYLPRDELGRGLCNVEHKSERMLLQLIKTLDLNQDLILRRKAILKMENERNSHLSKIATFLKVKYNLQEEINNTILEEAQKSSLFSEINNKVNHAKLFRLRKDPLISMKESSIWLRNGNISPREEGSLTALQDRNIFLEKGIKCPHCNDKYKSVDHMATQCDRMLSHDYMRRHNEALRCIHLQLCLNYGIKKSKKIRNHSLQEYVSNDRAEIRVDTRIPTSIQVKHNKPDIFVLDKIKKEILIVEVGITSFDHLRAVEVEKKNKYDVLANHCGALHGFKTRIIPYVMTWDGLVTTYHRTYRKELDLDNRIEAYVQSRVLKMTLESLTLDSRRETQPTEVHQEERCVRKDPTTRPESPAPTACESN